MLRWKGLNLFGAQWAIRQQQVPCIYILRYSIQRIDMCHMRIKAPPRGILELCWKPAYRYGWIPSPGRAGRWESGPEHLRLCVLLLVVVLSTTDGVVVLSRIDFTSFEFHALDVLLHVLRHLWHYPVERYRNMTVSLSALAVPAAQPSTQPFSTCWRSLVADPSFRKPCNSGFCAARLILLDRTRQRKTKIDNLQTNWGSCRRERNRLTVAGLGRQLRA